MLDRITMARRETVGDMVVVDRMDAMSCPYVFCCQYTCLGTPDSMAGCQALRNRGLFVEVVRPQWATATGYDGHQRP